MVLVQIIKYGPQKVEDYGNFQFSCFEPILLILSKMSFGGVNGIYVLFL